MRRLLTVTLFGALALLFMPAHASAQSTIAGLVTDTTGSVLPGVTVEAASPALIEKTRSAVTDGQGRYSIVDLRPGVYTITFTLSGFNTVKRDGIEVASNTSVPINIELRVGALEETITVSGQTPVVDVQTTARRQVLTREGLDAIPTSRNFQQIGSLMPGVKMSAPDVGSANSMNMTTLSGRGVAAKETTYLVDGMDMRSMSSDGTVQYYPNNAMTQEFNYQTSGIGAETAGGGILVNMIPQQGGNTYHGSIYVGGSPNSWIGDNVNNNPKFQALNFSSGDGATHIIEVNTSAGGPIRRDKLWFYGSYRYQAVDQIVGDTQYPTGPVNRTNWWRPETWNGAPGVSDQFIKNASLRLTTQLSQRHKLTAYYDRTYKAQWHDLVAGQDPATASRVSDPKHLVYYNAQAKWTGTLSNRLLAEAGYSSTLENRTSYQQPGVDQARGTAEWFGRAAHQDIITGRSWWASTLGLRGVFPARYAVTSSASYVTGSHSAKFGVQYVFGQEKNTTDFNADLVQRYRSGAADSVVIRNTPTEAEERVNADIGIYAQDSWTVRRLTVNGGVRLDHLNASIEETSVQGGRFVPLRHLDRIENLPNFTNVSPRFGAAYDLFGNAKTALKASFGKYMETWATGFAARYNPMGAQSEIRTWSDLNNDDIAQEIEIGASPNALFGIPTRTRRPSDDIERAFNTELTLGVQHQLVPGVSVSATWYHRALHNLERLDDRSLTLNDYTPVSIVNPLNGEVFTVYNLKPEKFGVPPDRVDSTSTDSDLRRNTYNGIETGFSARFGNGGTAFGGWSIERTQDVRCDSTWDPNTHRFCDQSAYGMPWRHEFKLAGAYPVVYGFQASVALVSWAGTDRGGRAGENGVNWSIARTTRYAADCTGPCTPGALVIPGLVPATLVVPLVQPGTLFNERWTQLDLGIRRTFRLGGSRTLNADLQAFNVLNTAVIRTVNNTYGTSLGRPTATLDPRVVRGTVTFKF
jgi:hypothetical protein